MPNIVITIFTQKFIGNIKIAEGFFQNLNQIDLLPDKIGPFEPLKTPYTFECAVKMWTKEEPGCYEDGIGMIGKAGSMTGKTQGPNFRFDVQWWNHPNKKITNNIRFYVSQKTFTKKKDDLLIFFRDTIQLFDASYGYISHEIPQDRQHVTGTIETRIPGIFWCNFFGRKYVDFFGEDKLLTFPWYKTEMLGERGFIGFLTKEPHELVESEKIEKMAKTHLGTESFGDVEEYIKNPTKIQLKKVPQLL